MTNDGLQREEPARQDAAWLLESGQAQYADASQHFDDTSDTSSDHFSGDDGSGRDFLA